MDLPLRFRRRKKAGGRRHRARNNWKKSSKKRRGSTMAGGQRKMLHTPGAFLCVCACARSVVVVLRFCCVSLNIRKGRVGTGIEPRRYCVCVCVLPFAYEWTVCGGLGRYGICKAFCFLCGLFLFIIPMHCTPHFSNSFLVLSFLMSYVPIYRCVVMG